MRQLTANVFIETGQRGSNHGLVTTSDGLVLIDGPFKPSDALRLKAEIERRGRLRYIINTEPHGDHWTANAFFDVPAIAHEGVRTRILGTDLAEHVARVGTFGPDEPKLLGRTLADYLKMLETDRDPERRRAALSAIEAFGAKSREAILAVGKAVRKDENEEVRRAAAQLLGGLGGDARDGLDDLAAAVKADASAVVREACASALGKIGSAAKPGVVVPVLAAALMDKDVKTRATAGEADE